MKRPKSSRRERQLNSSESAGEPRLKRRRGGEPAPVGRYANKPSAAWSVYRANVKRKPEARRKPAINKALQRGASNPGLEKRAPQRAINAARRRKATMPAGATRHQRSATGIE